MPRIVFPGNPWPDGHRIAQFAWTGRYDLEGLWFDFHLETAAYDEGDSGSEGTEDWTAPIAWNNYHHCTLSTRKWGDRGVFVGDENRPFDLTQLRTLTADPLPISKADFRETRSFGIYLLGHDAVADHRWQFSRVGGSDFRIDWTGKIALAYVGDDEFKYTFRAHHPAAHFGGFASESGASDREAQAVFNDLVRDPALYRRERLGDVVWMRPEPH